jgi:predicted RNase H-like nuclease (RuvC/YqgF family)
MYIRAKHYKDRTYYAVVRSERDGGKVHQRLVTYLGKHRTLEAAISDLEARIENVRLVVEQWQTRFNAPQRVAEEKWRLRELKDRLETLRALQREMQKRRSAP